MCRTDKSSRKDTSDNNKNVEEDKDRATTEIDKHRNNNTYNRNLRIAIGGTFSYYEFKHPMDNRLTDEEWHDMLDTDPPLIPTWMHDNLAIIGSITQTLVIFRKE